LLTQKLKIILLYILLEYLRGLSCRISQHHKVYTLSALMYLRKSLLDILRSYKSLERIIRLNFSNKH
jgi:hypothetical protein